MYRGTLMQSADKETKKDVAIKTIKSMHLYPSPFVMEAVLLFTNFYFRVYVFSA